MATTTSKTRTPRRLLSALAAGIALTAVTETVQAQEILLTGPLAGAPAVRKLRLYREGRFEIAPAVSFTLLDEYQRTILFGGRINYNLTDWFAIGVWGAHGTIKLPTALSDHIQEVNAQRQDAAAAEVAAGNEPPLDTRLTAVNMSADFTKQLSGINWILAPQLTAVPFRGKISLFQSIYLDTDLYFFVGPAFVGLTERAECGRDVAERPDCTQSFNKTDRVAIAPTFGLGFSFYVNKWNAIGFEWRGLPFAWNLAGFDVAGSGKDDAFPDNQVTSADQQFRFNQMLTVSYNFYLPIEHRISE
jgi:hypothetical protein